MKVLVVIQDDACVKALSEFVLSYPWPIASKFYVMHVVKPVLVNSYMALVPSVLSEPLEKARWEQGQKTVRDFALKLRDAWKSPFVDEIIEEGNATEEIKAVITGLKPDAVVMGSHSKHGIQALGSVSRSLLAAAGGDNGCSVITVPLFPEKAAQHYRESKMHMIV